jgi:hypothetical protein
MTARHTVGSRYNRVDNINASIILLLVQRSQPASVVLRSFLVNP